MDATKKIGFLIIGTNKYLDLAEQCAEFIHRNIKIDDYIVETIVFTNLVGPNSNLQKLKDLMGVDHHMANHYFHIDHLPWPLITLLRYQTFIRYEEVLRTYDYLYYIDADMKVVAPIGKEILGERVACQHPGLYGKPVEYLPFEYEPKSTACIGLPIGTMYNKYFFGALQGGSSTEFLKMSRILRDRINADLKNNYIAIWHDESQMNKYFCENPPDVILGKEYAYVDKWFKGTPLESIKKIEALEKDHEKFRKE